MNEVLLHFISLLTYQEAPGRSPTSGETISPRRLALLAYSLEETLKNQDSDDNTNRCKTIDFNEQNNGSSRAMCILVHFIPILYNDPTGNDQFEGFTATFGLFFVFKSPLVLPCVRIRFLHSSVISYKVNNMVLLRSGCR